MTKPLNETLLTEKMVSEMLGLKPRTLQQWRFVGRGPKYIKLSERVIRYKWSDVQDWVATIQDRQKIEKLS